MYIFDLTFKKKISKEGSTKNVHFMTHEGIDSFWLRVGLCHIGHIVKMHYFLKTALSTVRLSSYQLSIVHVIISKEGSTIKWVSDHDPSVKVLLLGSTHYDHVVNMHDMHDCLNRYSSIFWSFNSGKVSFFQNFVTIGARNIVWRIWSSELVMKW